MACHGIDGNSLNGKIAPKIAAQNSNYLTIQLRKFKEGVRKNALMQGIASNLSTEEMNNLGIYFSEQKLKLSAAKTNGVGSLGEKIFRAGLKIQAYQHVQAVMDPPDMGYQTYTRDLMVNTQNIHSAN